MMKKSMVLMPVLALASVANLLLAATFVAQSANACQLGTLGPATGAEDRPQGADTALSRLQKAHAVFSGVVVGTSLDHGTATFDVEESWKGVFKEPVVVRSTTVGADCRPVIYPQVGGRYLVYAHSNPDEDVPLNANPDSGTKLLNKAEADLQALGPGSRSLFETGGFGSGPAPVIVASGALLFVGTLGALTLWRWRRLTHSAPGNTRR